MSKTQLLTHEELKKQKLHRPIRNVNADHRKSLSHLELFAVWITDKVGSMGFFIVVFAWTIFWLGWNTLGPKESRFDPYPAFDRVIAELISAFGSVFSYTMHIEE